MAERRKINQPLRVGVKLGDGSLRRDQVRAFATVRDESKSIIVARFELFDDLDGYFTDDNATLMPNIQYLYVEYELRNLADDAFTSLYTPQTTIEEFLRDVTGETIDDGISATSSSNDNIEGLVNDDPSIDGELEDQLISGEVSEDTITGEVQDEC